MDEFRGLDSQDFFTSSKIFYSAAFVSFHMLAVPDDIGSKYNCNLTINLIFRHVRIPIEPIDVCMVGIFSPNKDMKKIICRDRNAVLRLKKPASVSSFSLPHLDTSVANQKIFINVFVVSGW